MGKFYETSSLFNYSWDQLAKAFWRRYPNPHSGHVLSEDTLCREIRGNELYSKRLLTKTNRLPKWGEHFVKSRETSVVEESLVNPETKTITTYTRNIGYTTIMSVVEKVVYAPDPENPNKTVAKREAWIESNLYGFRRAIESFGVKRFKKNCIKAAEGFNVVLASLYATVQNKDNLSYSSSIETAGAGVGVGGGGAVDNPTSMKEMAKQRIRDLAKRKATMGAVSVYAAPTNEPTGK